ncbi:MAG: SRPBCC domain-containing protein [Roseivirga sp.]|nr:SRPBCC domain-containing protein [Roseivirga sp.]
MTKSTTGLPDGKAKTIKTTFSTETAVSIEIEASPEVVWALLTNASDYVRWNSTLMAIEGAIREGESIKLEPTVNPGKTFKIKIAEVVPGTSMQWVSGTAPFFRGVRLFSLQTTGNGKTRFSMSEKIKGLMYPIAAGQLPDFTAPFEQFAADLKSEAEIIRKLK